MSQLRTPTSSRALHGHMPAEQAGAATHTFFGCSLARPLLKPDLAPHACCPAPTPPSADISLNSHRSCLSVLPPAGQPTSPSAHIHGKARPHRALLHSCALPGHQLQTLTDVLLLLPLQISLALVLTVAGPMTVPFGTSQQSDVITPWTQFFGNHLQSVTINNSQEDLANNSVSSQPLCMGPWWMLLGLRPLAQTVPHTFFWWQSVTQCSTDGSGMLRSQHTASHV